MKILVLFTIIIVIIILFRFFKSMNKKNNQNPISNIVDLEKDPKSDEYKPKD